MLQSLAAVAVAAAVAAPSSDQPPKTLVVQLVHRCRPASSCVPRRIVRLMKKETQRIWSSLDVRIIWIDSNGAGSAASAAGLTVVLEKSAYPGSALERGVVLATLNQPASQCGSGVAHVWVRHIEDHAALVWRGRHAFSNLLAAFADTFLGRALGRALAHEIGHYLLGTREHTEDGLMRPQFTPQELLQDAGRPLYRLDSHARARLIPCRADVEAR
jgi:hypothetical protein